MIFVTTPFSKSSVFKIFSVHTKTQSWRISNSFGLRSVFKKLRFRDGLVWTVGLTVQIKLRFQISPARCERALRVDVDQVEISLNTSFYRLFQVSLSFELGKATFVLERLTYSS